MILKFRMACARFRERGLWDALGQIAEEEDSTIDQAYLEHLAVVMG